MKAAVLVQTIRMWWGYIVNLPGRFRRRLQWRKYMEAAERDHKRRSEAAKRGWVTRKQRNLTHVQSLADFKADRGTPHYEHPAMDEGADIVDVA